MVLLSTNLVGCNFPEGFDALKTFCLKAFMEDTVNCSYIYHTVCSKFTQNKQITVNSKFTYIFHTEYAPGLHIIYIPLRPDRLWVHPCRGNSNLLTHNCNLSELYQQCQVWNLNKHIWIGIFSNGFCETFLNCQYFWVHIWLKCSGALLEQSAIFWICARNLIVWL